MRSKFQVKIKHPDWLNHSHPQKNIDIFKQGFYPSSLAGWFIVVGLKHPLRAVYGSDLKAALALLWQAIRAKTVDPLEFWWWRITKPKEYREMREEVDAGVRNKTVMQ